MNDLSIERARERDRADPLARFRSEFHFPHVDPAIANGAVYLVGNSLGLMPTRTRACVNQELDEIGRAHV